MSSSSSTQDAIFVKHTYIIMSVLRFKFALIPFLSFLLFPISTTAQATTQQQICTNACAAAKACDSQCNPGTGADAYETCLCQGGCLCNAEICLQCCKVTGNNLAVLPSCNTANQIAAGDVISFCGIVRPLFCFFACAVSFRDEGLHMMEDFMT